jgi:hypothetical protein
LSQNHFNEIVIEGNLAIADYMVEENASNIIIESNFKSLCTSVNVQQRVPVLTLLLCRVVQAKREKLSKFLNASVHQKTRVQMNTLALKA